MIHVAFQSSEITESLQQKILLFNFIKNNYLNAKYSGYAKISMIHIFIKKTFMASFYEWVQLFPD